MNIKLNNIVINPEFSELFESNEIERLELNAQMISFRVLSEVEKICNEKNIKKKDLAEMTGTSKSYITQLFNGAKSVNTVIMAKFEDALDFSFNIGIKMHEQIEFQDFAKHLSADIQLFANKTLCEEQVWAYRCTNESTNDMVKNMETENNQNEKAA